MIQVSLPIIVLTQKMNIRQLNDFPITDLLEREGIFPVRKRGNEWWYLSPIRSRERTASFKVDVFLNRWYDHGIGLGGKLFDLAMRLYNRIDPRDTIKILEGHFSSHIAANSIIWVTGPNVTWITAVDRSNLYRKFNDLNDYLLGKVMEKQTISSKRHGQRNRI
jgi:hypothetical protein